MPITRLTSSLISLALLSFAYATDGQAFAAQDSPKEKGNTQERRLIELAQQTATIAGGARYCLLDRDDIEEFISKADARIVLMARDDYQKVLGRLEFKNILAASSAREPKNGCDNLKVQFATMLRDSR